MKLVPCGRWKPNCDHRAGVAEMNEEMKEGRKEGESTVIKKRQITGEAGDRRIGLRPFTVLVSLDGEQQVQRKC